MKPITRHICKNCKVSFNSISSVCDGCGVDTLITATEKSHDKQLGNETAFNVLKADYNSLVEQIKHLGAVINSRDIPTSQIITEAIYKIQKIVGDAKLNDDFYKLVNASQKLNASIFTMIQDWRDGDFVLSRLAAIHIDIIEERVLNVTKLIRCDINCPPAETGYACDFARGKRNNPCGICPLKGRNLTIEEREFLSK